MKNLNLILKEENNLMVQLREIRNAISKEIKDMDNNQIKEHIHKKDSLFPNHVWKKIKST
jgi:hypothetical protein